MKHLITRWRAYRQHQRAMKRFFALLEQETVSLRETMLALAEVYAEHRRMAAERQEGSR
jgi:hypothetical protein